MAGDTEERRQEMNLERIKYRAKEKFTGSWVYGFPYKSSFGNWFILSETNKYHILEETLGQYTGLKDKDGKDIYEGDIITLREYVSEVIWNNNRTSFCIRFSFEAQVGTESLGAWIDSKRGCRILGNIFDNKNLLEQ